MSTDARTPIQRLLQFGSGEQGPYEHIAADIRHVCVELASLRAELDAKKLALAVQTIRLAAAADARDAVIRLAVDALEEIIRAPAWSGGNGIPDIARNAIYRLEAKKL